MVCIMPTDGADFGRTKPCYGKAYTMAREGAEDADVAECAIRGVEIDIKRDGGVPAFSLIVDLLVRACDGADNGRRLLMGVDEICRDFADSPLTRHFTAAAERIGLEAIAQGRPLLPQQVAENLIVKFAESRCCDGMLGYVARHRTKDFEASLGIVGSIKSKLDQAPSMSDLAARMLNGSKKGMPAKAVKVAPVTHSAESLNNEEI